MRAPQLLVVVDTEEEFDWDGPFSRDSVGTRSIPSQARAHAIFDRFGVVPTYVVDYPVAIDAAAIDFFGALRADGKAEIGAHLHPWVTPPLDEDVNAHNSYHCNLAPALERDKIERLTATIADAFGAAPTIFKAGRYGFGANTRRVLMDLGYRIDCSYVPFTSFEADGGPSFYGTREEPFWLDREQTLLEVPITSGYIGLAAGLGPRIQPLFDSRRSERLRIPGMLARSHLVARSRLTPEGVSAAEQCRLLRTLVAKGRRTFTLSYHSPSLAPGNTPYVRSEGELAAFLQTIEEVLGYFRDTLGGSFTTLTALYEQMAQARAPQRKFERA